MSVKHCGLSGAGLAPNTGRAVNLSDLNLAYAVLHGLNFAHVNFDDDLLCRTIFNDSSFQGATLQGADLRFATLKNAQGPTAGQVNIHVTR
jgi:uncharacterized protein YjbI with pentapeptide repeats